MRKLAGERLARLRIGVEQRRADDGLVRDHEHVVLTVLRVEIDDDMLDGHVDRSTDALDDVATKPARSRLRVRGDDDGVGRRHELRERIAHDVNGIGVDDEAVGGDAVRPQQVEGLVEPAARRRAARVLVDDEAFSRRRDRTGDGDTDRALGGATLERLDEALAGDRLVRDHEHVRHRRTSSSSDVTASSSCFASPSSENTA